MSERKGSFWTAIWMPVFFFALLNLAARASCAEVTTIRYAAYLPPSYTEIFAGINKFSEVINTKGQGKVKVEVFDSEKLLKAKELLTGLTMGTVEAVGVPMVYWHGTFPLSQGLSLPNIWSGNFERYYKAIEPGSPIANLLNEDFGKKNIFMVFGLCDGNEVLWTKGKPVSKPDDLKGLKIRASGLIPAEVLKRLGASPVDMPSGDMYTALQRGTIDGIFGSIMTIHSRGMQEQLDHMTNYPFEDFGPLIIAFRKDWYDGLPGDVKSIVDEASKAYRTAMYNATLEVMKDRIEAIKTKVQIIIPDDSGTRLFDNKLLPMYDWWTKRPEVGEKGQRLLELIAGTK
jgi:TRAP-type C4-dicarboxylate transport system substrate-binding protein